ncbi:MAG: hypothetical protein WA766_14700, partial [Candidatus Acidiferrales bacterium]
IYDLLPNRLPADSYRNTSSIDHMPGKINIHSPEAPASGASSRHLHMQVQPEIHLGAMPQICIQYSETRSHPPCYHPRPS